MSAAPNTRDAATTHSDRAAPAAAAGPSRAQRAPPATCRTPEPAAPQGLARVEDESDDEGPELGVLGRHRIEAHLVHDVLQRDRVVGQQRDAPFPVVETNRAGDELEHATRV